MGQVAPDGPYQVTNNLDSYNRALMAEYLWRLTAMGDAPEDSDARRFTSYLKSIPFGMRLYDPIGEDEVTFEETARFDDGTTQEALAALVQVANIDGWGITTFDVDLYFPEGESNTYQRIDAEPNEGDPGVALTFDDGSVAYIDQMTADEAEIDSGSLPLDHPSRLSETITADEYGTLEALVGHLQQLLDEAAPAEDVRLRIEGAIGVLRGTHRAAEVGDTERREIVPVVKGVLGYMRKELPRDLMAWRGAIETIADVYPSIADFISSL